MGLFVLVSRLTLLLLTLNGLSKVLSHSYDCNNTAMDLVLVADSSTSIKAPNFRLMKGFLAKVVSGFPTDSLHVRVAIVRFSSAVDVIVTLAQSAGGEDLQKALTNMAFKIGGTNTYTALQTVRERILVPANGRRPEVPAVVLVVTDGESWNVNRTVAQASLLRQQDVRVLALGIGAEVSMDELHGMSGGFVRNISDFDSLDSIVDNVRDELCAAAVTSSYPSTVSIAETSSLSMASTPYFKQEVTFGGTVSSTADTTKCLEQRVDMVFVVDASYSVGTANFEQAKSFVSKVVSGLPIGQRSVRVALVRYDSKVDVISPFLDTMEAVTSSVSNMTYPGASGTNTGGALRTAREQVLGTRVKEEEVKDVVITITDGESDDFYDTEDEAILLRSLGARLVWLYIYRESVGMDNEKNTMEAAGDSVMAVQDFSDLTDDIVTELVVASCADQTATTSAEVTTALPTTDPSTTFSYGDSGITTAESIDSSTEQPVSTIEQSVSTTDSSYPTTEQPAVSTEMSSSSTESSIVTTESLADPPTTETKLSLSTAKQTLDSNLTTSATEDPEVTFTVSSEAVYPEGVTTSSVLFDRLSTEQQTGRLLFDEDRRDVNETTWTPAPTTVTEDVDLSSSSPASDQTTSSSNLEMTVDEAETTSPKPESASVSVPTIYRVPERSTALAEISSLVLRESPLTQIDDKVWHNDWPFIVGVTIGAAGIAGLTTGAIVFALRRRKQRKHEITPASPAP